MISRLCPLIVVHFCSIYEYFITFETSERKLDMKEVISKESDLNTYRP